MNLQESNPSERIEFNQEEILIEELSSPEGRGIEALANRLEIKLDQGIDWQIILAFIVQVSKKQEK